MNSKKEKPTTLVSLDSPLLFLYLVTNQSPPPVILYRYIYSILEREREGEGTCLGIIDRPQLLLELQVGQ